jgi:hypothetical protein
VAPRVRAPENFFFRFVQISKRSEGCMTAINLKVDLQVSGGPKLIFNDQVEVDAYDSIEVTLAKDETKTVAVQPGNADKVKLLFIKSTPASDKVHFENKDSNDLVTLLNPVLLMGDAVAVLANPPKDLKFKNGSTGPATITILVGRTAV